MNVKSFFMLSALAFSANVHSELIKDKNNIVNEKPNILFILSDDHSYPFLSCYGNKDVKTPNIDKIASQGFLYTRAYTTAPQSVPSRASMLTGRNVLDVEMSRFSAALKRKYTVFPEVLRENGYFTGICGRSYHLDGSSAKAKETQDVFDAYGLQTFHERVDYLKMGEDSLVIDLFREFLSLVPDGKPFFMWANYSDPHRPFDAYEYEPNPESITMPATIPDTPAFRKDLAAHYGEINRLDKRVGLLLKELEDRGMENTIIVFMGDNGSALLRGKGTLYETGLRVPLAIKWNGKILPGLISDALFSGEDLAPTLLDAVGINIPEDYTGKSFVPTFTNPEVEIRDTAYAIRASHGSGLPLSTVHFDLIRAIITKDYKLIYNVLWQLPYMPVDFAGMPSWKDMIKQHQSGTLEKKFDDQIFPENRPIFELYNLNEDPDEFVNLVGKQEYIAIEENLKAALHKWMILYNDYVPLPITPKPRR